VLLYSLPRVVVDNTESGIPAESPDSTNEADPGIDRAHNQQVSSDDQSRINSLKASIEKEENPEKTSIFADSLAKVYLEYQIYDSAATYFERAAEIDPSEESWEKAGDAYYEAFSYSRNSDIADFHGQKAREYYQKILDTGQERLDLKTKIGMTLVSSSNPMQGITMLREVLEQDPDNEDAQYNLGILAFQTGQYPLAIERFENVVRVNYDNVQGHFYLGLSYLESGEIEKAREQLNIVKKMDMSPEVQATVDTYLKDID
jgi:tetratricopeptide (TPR) repeat protein